jgi:hypothetical protein
MGNIKTILLSGGIGFVVGYGSKWLVDYFAAKKTAAKTSDEEEAAE